MSKTLYIYIQLMHIPQRLLAMRISIHETSFTSYSELLLLLVVVVVVVVLSLHIAIQM